MSLSQHRLYIIKALLSHTWLSFRRAHFFSKGLAIKAVMLFAGAILIWSLYLGGLLMPALLAEVFPDKQSLPAFFSLLIPILLADLLLRLFMQKLPRQDVRSYLTLPVSRSLVADLILLRSFPCIYNFYLLPLVLPFYLNVCEPGAQLWLAFAGTLMLIVINHSITIWIKSQSSPALARSVALVLIGVIAFAGASFYRAEILELSARLGTELISGNPYVFLAGSAVFATLLMLSKKALLVSFYQWTDAGQRKGSAESSRVEKWLAAVPVWGLYWELEWRLLIRNKRSSAGFRQWPLVIPAFPLLLYLLPPQGITEYVYVMIMIAGGYGFFHLQYVFSWESRFFDMLAAKNADIRIFIQSKYYFYCLLALLKLIPMLILLYFAAPRLLLPMAGMFLYVTGPVFAFLFYTGVGNSTRIDPDKKQVFNVEGSSGNLFITIIAVMFSITPLVILAYLLPMQMEYAIFAVTATTGIAFLLTHRKWIRAVSGKMEKRKYHNLSKYREK